MEEFYYNADDIINKIYTCCKLLLGDNEEIVKSIKWFSITPTFLLYGLPGTGKTSVANEVFRRLKKDYNIYKYELMIEKCLSANFGESSQNLIAFFDDIENDLEQNNMYGYVVIDEIDSFTLSRHIKDNISIQRVLNTFSKELDHLVFNGKLSKMIIIATTNLKDSIDVATLRRFYFHINFDRIMNDEEFESFIKELTDPIQSLKVDQSSMHKLYDIYLKKRFTLGELKRIIANYWIKDINNWNNTSMCLRDYFMQEDSYYESYLKQEKKYER